MGSKFSRVPERARLELRLTEAAKRLLQADLENICVENIQTCIILATLSAGNGRTQSQALYLRKSSRWKQSTSEPLLTPVRHR